jgi:glycosyltransferase involved in cell wall biosynthesis
VAQFDNSVFVENMKISLIICSRNRDDFLRRCLDTIRQAELADIQGELILVDSNSTDDTEKIMLEYKNKAPFSVKVIKADRKGLGYARKLASQAAEGEILVFTDDDCYLEEGYLLKAAKIFDDGTFQYCGGRILLYDPQDAKFALNLKDQFEYIPPHSYLRTGIIQGANFVVHKKVIDAIGSFDEKLGAGTRFRCEDIDLAARASRAGFTGAHVPELVVYHHHGRKPGPELIELKKQNDFARGAYFIRMIQLKEFKYLREWFKLWRKPGDKGMRFRELRGAVGYLFFRLRGK